MKYLILTLIMFSGTAAHAYKYTVNKDKDGNAHCPAGSTASSGCSGVATTYGSICCDDGEKKVWVAPPGRTPVKDVAVKVR